MKDQPSSSMPLVTAIVLSFNRRDETIACLESLKQQDYENLEVLVLDNGSQDGSAALIKEVFPTVRLINMPLNYGDWQGRDIALANADGEFIACIDNDAVVPENALSSMVRAMIDDPKLAVVEPRVADPNSGQTFSEPEPLASKTHFRANFLGGAALYRSEALEKAGGFPHYLLGGAEAHLALRFIDMGYRILHLGDVTLYHQMSPKERVPHQRFFLSSLQRLRAYMSHYPGFARPAADFVWKLGNYSFEATKRGYIWRLFVDLPRLGTAGIYSWMNGEWRVKKETINLMDFLTLNTIESSEEYDQIPRDMNLFKHRLSHRLRRT